jgi:hypothetical protein
VLAVVVEGLVAPFRQHVRVVTLSHCHLSRLSLLSTDASRVMIHQAARAADAGAPNVRRLVSETKKFVTEAAWDVVNVAMQVTGGIGYTDVYPIERAVRDIRLMQIWTGTNEIMSAMIQHDLFQEFRAERPLPRTSKETPCTTTRRRRSSRTMTCGRCTRRAIEK